jgi:formylglycine-generating enzyme required for sulfatase activity
MKITLVFSLFIMSFFNLSAQNTGNSLMGSLKVLSNVSGTIKIDGISKGNISAYTVSVIELKPDKYLVQFFPDDGRVPKNNEVIISPGKSETINFEVSAASQQNNIASNNSNLLLPEMVFVQGGTFTMGCTAEQSYCLDGETPAHSVMLKSFYVGKYEVTQEQWLAVMGFNPSYFGTCYDCPVENVSWNDIQKFIEKLNQQTGKRYRLPTEAEWEFTAHGGLKSNGYKFSGSNDVSSIAWYTFNSNHKTHPVGKKQPNELGVYDMSGNVWEYCNDWYRDNYYSSSPSSNPTGPSSGSGRVLRGGSWEDFPIHCRVYDRNLNDPDFRDFGGGFRLVLEP